MKPLLVISAPVDTYSGYGARSRGIAKAIIELDKYDVKILSQMWGSTPWGFIKDHQEEWGFLSKHFVTQTSNQRKPDVWVQITVPNEFQPIGNYNIGITAGIEATQCSPPWIEGCNRMNMVLLSSNFSKQVFQQSAYSLNNPQGQVVKHLKIEKPLDVIFEGVDLNIYNQESDVKMLDIKESFAFLVAGHWLKGAYGEDRKNIGKTIKLFFEAFKNMENPPAMVLKTGSDGSISEQENLIEKINAIRSMVKGKLPQLYLVSGNLSDTEVNQLYRDPKIKAMVSFTKGEGFGRPLAEFALTKKPIIVSNWSGHTDFIKPEFAVLLGGELKNIHDSAAWKDVLMKEAKWFNIDEEVAIKAMKDVHKSYKDYIKNSRKSRQYIKDNFSYEKMKEKLSEILEENVKIEAQLNLPNMEAPKLQLPKLKKIGENKTELPKLKLPKLKKVTT